MITLHVYMTAKPGKESELEAGIRDTWISENFDRLRRAHRERTWDRDGNEGEPICRNCAVTKKPTPIAVEV